MPPRDFRTLLRSRGETTLGLVPILLLLFAALLWGAIYSLYKLATEAGIPFIPFVFWQVLGASIILLAISAVRRRLPPLDLLHLRAYAIVGILGAGLPACFYAFVASRLPAGVISLTALIEPMLTFLIAALFAIEPLRPLRALGLLCGLGGVLLIVLPDASLPERAMVGWVLLVLVAPVIYASHNVLIERYWPRGCNSLTLSAGGLFVGALALLPAIAVTDSWWAFPSGIGVGEWALIGSTFIVAVSSLLFFEVVRRAGAVFASTGTYIEALAAIGWGILLFDERHSAWIWASVAALMVGLYLVNRSGRNRAPPGV